MTTASQWPDEGQSLLLRAALEPGPAALEAFAAWRGQVDIDGDIDAGSYRLLPLVYANLSRLGCQDRLMGRLRGIYRYSWCEAQSHVARASRIAELLAARGIPAMASKGLVLANDYYDSPALRPMSDIDLTVPPDRALEAIAALKAGGWVPEIYVNWIDRPKDMLVLISEVKCRHADGGELDLHWRMLNEFEGGGADARFWAGARSLKVGEVELLRPSPTDLLFHVVVHGMRRNAVSPIRWIPDAALILRRDGAVIDWEGMIAFARKIRLGNRLSQGLIYLRESMGLLIPDLFRGSRPLAPTLTERIDNRIALQDSATLSPRVLDAIDNARIFLRLLQSENRRHIPRLTARWVARRLGVWAGA